MKFVLNKDVCKCSNEVNNIEFQFVSVIVTICIDMR